MNLQYCLLGSESLDVIRIVSVQLEGLTISLTIIILILITINIITINALPVIQGKYQLP